MAEYDDAADDGDAKMAMPKTIFEFRCAMPKWRRKDGKTKMKTIGRETWQLEIELLIRCLLLEFLSLINQCECICTCICTYVICMCMYGLICTDVHEKLVPPGGLRSRRD